MTYEDFLEGHRIKALCLLIEERSRYTCAQKLFMDYEMRMKALNLKAMTWLQIGDRLTELRIAEENLEENYGDTELMRSRYKDLHVSPELPIEDRQP